MLFVAPHAIYGAPCAHGLEAARARSHVPSDVAIIIGGAAVWASMGQGGARRGAGRPRRARDFVLRARGVGPVFPAPRVSAEIWNRAVAGRCAARTRANIHL